MRLLDPFSVAFRNAELRTERNMLANRTITS
jgi:hypothetical protein